MAKCTTLGGGIGMTVGVAIQLGTLINEERFYTYRVAFGHYDYKCPGSGCGA